MARRNGYGPLNWRAYPSGSKKYKNAKEAKMREEEVATKSREIQDCYFTVAVKSSGDISEEPEEDSKARNKL